MLYYNTIISKKNLIVLLIIPGSLAIVLHNSKCMSTLLYIHTEGSSDQKKLCAFYLTLLHLKTKQILNASQQTDPPDPTHSL